MRIKTKIYNKYQTVIPKEIRKQFNIDKNHLVEWNVDEEGKITLSFVENINFDEMAGIFSSKSKKSKKLIKHKK
ncbi:AbrB/MazE/SpoVT family DNA-binding domain-containing protein [Methanobrevibacter curvatus]|uniref:Putative regulator PrlF n=1 Tax=Methanobrevibacter curvatus TaxID=49547 RepID=A0A166AVW7_9EURY|nr:AbrB/MazE/SpoVT family DNA-binding domain-containing protein [Methanobrevibacter curvatus]KZX12534.1 putative regulator PrlF [Methanobrevibacter curvatus]